MATPKPKVFRTAYGPHARQKLADFRPSLAKQSFRDEVDINNIVSRFANTGVIEHLNKYDGNYGDFTVVQPYQDALNTVMAAQEAFDSLPSKIRTRFNNDPEQFLNFATDPKNTDELVSMGLAHRPPPPTEPFVPQPAADPPPAE